MERNISCWENTYLPQKHPIQVTECDECYSGAALGGSPSARSRRRGEPVSHKGKATRVVSCPGRHWSGAAQVSGP